jgi:PAS domain S-box-containing protein
LIEPLDSQPVAAPAGHSLRFLEGDSEMPRIMRAKDWSATSLGEPSHWPQALRLAVRLILNCGHPMYIWWGPQGACLYNDAYRQSIGPERHPSSLGQPAQQVWEEIWDIIGWQIEQVMAGGAATWHENALVPITRNGKREDVYWTYTYSPIDDDTAPNGVGGVLVVCTETTKSVLAQRRITAEHEKQLQLLKQMPGFVAVLRGPEHVYEYANDAYNEIAGARDLIGRTVRDAFPELEGQPYFDLLDGVYASGARYVARGVPVLLTGHETARFIDLLYEPIRDSSGVVSGIFVGGYDVTVVHEAAQAQRDSETKLRQLNVDLEQQVIERTRERGLIWQISRDLMATIDSTGVLGVSNPAWSSVLGWSEEEMSGRALADLVHPDDRAEALVALQMAPLREPIMRVVTRFRHRDNSYRWISWTAIPQAGRLYYTGRDITREKAAQEELQRAQEALRQSQKMEAVGQLTGGLAHDFNNLLAAISGSVEVVGALLDRGRLGEVGRYLTAAQNSTRRAAALTQRLLAFSRRQTLDPKPTDVNRLVAGMEDLVRRTIGPSVALEVVGAGGLWLTRVDASQLENSLLNLCLNARDAMLPNGGRLTIETANRWLDDRAAKERDVIPGQYISLCVTDTGTGMSADVMERAFDPFFTTKPLGEGTGLGLSMVYGFARQSGGQVRIYSEVGKGTTLCLYLPRYTGVLEKDSEPEADNAATEGRGETVLVVDDEPTIRMLIRDVLVEHGYSPLEAADGPAALKILNSNIRIELLITDVGLPGGINGRQVADAARVSRPGLKVLFITGFAENAVVGNGHLEPGMEVLTKPFVVASLGARIRALIDQPRRG